MLVYARSFCFFLPHSPVVLWILLISVVFVINSCSSLVYSTVFLFINNSVMFDKLGAINGLAMTFSSLSRSVSDIVIQLELCNQRFNILAGIFAIAV